MKKTLFFTLFCLVFLSRANADEVRLTSKQFKNIDSIDSELRKKYPQSYVGLNGSQEKMDFIGLSEDEVNDEIKKIDFSEIEKRKSIIDQEVRLVSQKIVELAIAEVEKTTQITEKQEVIDRLSWGAQ